MNKTALTDEEVGVLRHALGLDRTRVSYRNRYTAAPRSPHYLLCMGLVTRGLMERSVSDGTMVPFRVTDAGRAVLTTK